MDNLHISYFDSNIIKFKKLSPLNAETIKNKKPAYYNRVCSSYLAWHYISVTFLFKIRGYDTPTVW